MKLIDASPHPIKIYTLKAAIEKEGIDCVLNNEHLSQLAGEVPVTACYVELYVDEADSEAAMKVFRQMSEKLEGEVLTWECGNCKESIEEQFNMCWNCEGLRGN